MSEESTSTLAVMSSESSVAIRSIDASTTLAITSDTTNGTMQVDTPAGHVAFDRYTSAIFAGANFNGQVTINVQINK